MVGAAGPPLQGSNTMSYLSDGWNRSTGGRRPERILRCGIRSGVCTARAIATREAHVKIDPTGSGRPGEFRIGHANFSQDALEAIDVAGCECHLGDVAYAVGGLRLWKSGKRCADDRVSARRYRRDRDQFSPTTRLNHERDICAYRYVGKGKSTRDIGRRADKRAASDRRRARVAWTPAAKGFTP